LSLLYVLYKQISLGTAQVGCAQKIFGEHCPRMPLVATGLYITVTHGNIGQS